MFKDKKIKSYNAEKLFFSFGMQISCNQCDQKLRKKIPHILILVKCKIIRLDFQRKNNFQIFLFFAVEMVLFSVLGQKQSLGPLGINYIIKKFQFQRLKCCIQQSAMQVFKFD